MSDIKRRWGLSVLFIGMLAIGFGQTNIRESIVSVYGHLGNKKVKAGSGFVVNLDGKNYIVTAYHVINGTIGVDAWSYSTKLGHIDSVRIVGYDDTLDLAVLASNEIAGLPPIKLGGFPPGHEADSIKDAKAWGNPNTIPDQPAPVNFASSSRMYPGLLHVNEIYDNDHQPIFIKNFTFFCIPMYTFANAGVSGGPIIANGVAVGVFSGSVNIGGAYSWAIPTSYLSKISRQRNLTNGINLPDLRSLLNSAGRLSRSLIVKSYNASVIEKYTPLNDVASLLDQHAADIREVATTLKSLSQSITGRLELLAITAENGRAAIIKQILDSIASMNYYEQVQSVQKIAFFKVKRDFDLTCDDLVETWRVAGAKVVNDSSLISDTREQLKLAMQTSEYKSYNYLSRLYDLNEFKKGQGAGNPTEADLLSNPDKWRRYCSMVLGINNDLADLVGTIDEEYQVARVYTDRIFELLIYKDL